MVQERLDHFVTDKGLIRRGGGGGVVSAGANSAVPEFGNRAIQLDTDKLRNT